MFVALKMFLHTLLPPPASPLLLAIAGSLLIWGNRKRLGAALLAVGLGGLWLCSVPVVSNALWRLAEHYPALDLSQPTCAQAIVILGGGLWDSRCGVRGACCVPTAIRRRALDKVPQDPW